MTHYDYDRPLVDKDLMKGEGVNAPTQGLFIEFRGRIADYTLYSWGEDHRTKDGILYPSLRKIYVEMGDPTEYRFAKTHLMGWKHWKRMKNNTILAPHIEEWREELEIRLVSMGIQTMIDKSADEGSTGLNAAKWLADKGWDKNKVGRPSKAEAERKERIKSKVEAAFDEDFKRLER